MKIMEDLAIKIDVSNDEEITKSLTSCIGTKFASRWGRLITDLSIKATRTIIRGGNLNIVGLGVFWCINIVPGLTIN